MTKKHLFTCSVILVLVIISGISIFGISTNKNKNHATQSSMGFNSSVFKIDGSSNDFSFANEALPIQNSSVNHKLQHSLEVHNFKNIRSYVLHDKAQKLFPIIEPILKAFGIPDDFKYVALVESGFGDGNSSKGARGLWQFLPGSARTYGLKVGRKVDERMDVRKSTIAACKYFNELYNEFNSWTLAAAAYNNGEIKLAKTINEQKEDNYFRMHLNSETGSYIYHVIAMKAIITHPEQYGYRGYIKLTTNNLMAYN
jgi:membrane-bound lytic murein transglycosylase D